LSKILREVRGDETVLVTSHGEPVATIATASRPARVKAKRRLLEDLRAQRTLDLPRVARDELYDE
jgi:prevent-host-death family protein